MAITIENTINNESISFEDFTKELEKIVVNEFQEEMVFPCADLLQKMSNNQSFITDFLNSELNKSLDNFQSDNPYSEQSFILYDSKWFYIRLTYWPKEQDNKRIADANNELFFYNLPHDHNFDFLTVGCKGQGYGTKLWEYDHENVIGYKNEKIDIRFLEETSLKKGKVMYYRRSKDIHSQFPPVDEDCVALNIIFNSFKQFTQKQFLFDTDNHKIKDLLSGSNGATFGILNAAKKFNNKKYITIIENRIKTQYNPILRRKMADILFDYYKDENVWKNLLRDQDLSNRRYANFQLEKIKNN